MLSNKAHPHRFDCLLVWTGADQGPTTSYESYSREYRLDFEGKPSLTGSAAPPFRGDASWHNPEDMLVAALSACHFLSYAALAARNGVHVLAYEDRATGTMELVHKVMRFTRVVLRPQVTIAEDSDPALARSLHPRAHASCFIANSVNFPVLNEPVIVVAARKRPDLSRGGGRSSPD